MDYFVDTRTENELLNGKEDFESEMHALEKRYQNHEIQVVIDIRSDQVYA